MLSFEFSKKWVTEELSDEDYKAILAYEMPFEDTLVRGIKCCVRLKLEE